MIATEDVIRLCKPAVVRMADDIRRFDYFDILGVPDVRHTKRIFFCTRDTGNSGWYDQPFDRARWLTARFLRRHPTTVYVFEADQRPAIEPENFMVVTSIDECLYRLCTFVRIRSHAVVIAVTGSVGKSTACRLVQTTLSHLGPCIVVPARRLTPLLVQDFILNKLGDERQFVVAEIGLYMAQHIDDLGALIRPDCAAVLNAYDVHTGWNGLEGISDVARKKLGLLSYSTSRIMNHNLRDHLPAAQGGTVTEFCRENVPTADLYVSGNSQDSLLVGAFRYRYEVRRWIKTAVFSDQILSVIAISHANGLCGPVLQRALDECRGTNDPFALRRIDIGNTKVFLDSHASYSGYFQALSEHEYCSIALAVASLRFVDEIPTRTIDGLVETFLSYDRILIHRALRRVVPEGVERGDFGNSTDLEEEVEDFDVVFLHDPQDSVSSTLIDRWG